MDPPPLSPSSTATTLTATVPTISPSGTKLRLMCSYGGNIVPRPQTNTLFYAGGDTRIITLDYRTTASSLSSLTTHLSHTLFNQRPFHLKYQLPGEDLDSLVSVINDEDFQNMLEEHDRVNGSVNSTTNSRIRLFLFSIKPDPIGSVLVDRKSDSWFYDALNNTGIIQRVKLTDKDLDHEFPGLDNVCRLDSNLSSQAQQEQKPDSLKNIVDNAGDNDGEAEVVIGRSNSLVLNTSLSFGSASSLVSKANLPVIGIQPEGNSVGMLEKKIRVPSSASIESDNCVASFNISSKKEIHNEQITQAVSGVPSINGEIENSNTDPPLPSPNFLQKAVQRLQYEHLPYTPVDPQYANQYPTGHQVSFAPYYPVYPLPAQNQVHNPYFLNQPYPVYFVPVRPNPNCSMSIDHQGSSLSDNGSVEPSTRPHLHPHNGVVDQTPRSQQHMIDPTLETNRLLFNQ